MTARETLKHALTALCCLAAAACAPPGGGGANDAAPAPEVATAAPPTSAPALMEANVAERAAAPETASSVLAAPPADGAPSADAPVPAAAVQPASAPVAAAQTELAPPEPPAVAPAVPITQEPAPSAVVVPSVLPPPSTATLDFASLVTRLRKTNAINLRTKLAVKNESDDLLERFRAYHARHETATLEELRASYDSLFGKLCSLLEDGDPPLARDIDRSRAAIWAVLADPVKFGASARRVSTRSVPPA
jgi:hypothetical protein